ncbi:MAG: DUF2116 family Zn-ribbon domain-containing protein, partial [Roseiflexaceae bacterium]
EHWRTIGGRLSPLTNSPRKAIAPFHTMLNYLYALLESETTIQLLVSGLDPAMGMFHTDTEYRNSFANDTMETVRPYVDKWLLETIAKRYFAANDFVEMPDGECRLTPLLTRQLAETIPLWRNAIIPMIQKVVTLLRNENATPIAKEIINQFAPTSLPRICAVCGAPVPAGRKRFCSDACRLDQRRAARRAQQEPAASPSADTTAPASPTPARRRKGGERPAATPEQQASYRTTLLPLLAVTPLAALIRATRLSRSYCKRIRTGAAIPHPVHWAALAALVGVELPAE